MVTLLLLEVFFQIIDMDAPIVRDIARWTDSLLKSIG